MERTGAVTFAGNPLTLLGSPTKVGAHPIMTEPSYNLEN